MSVAVASEQGGAAVVVENVFAVGVDRELEQPGVPISPDRLRALFVRPGHA